MKILVTGSSGFIAKHYIHYIENQGFDVVPFDLPENDIRCYEDVLNALSGCDMLVHFAAVADLNHSRRNLIKNHEVNIDGSFQVARACMMAKKKLIFISTCCVYGDTKDIPETEWRTAPMTNEPYACSKVAGEYIVRGMPNLNYCILRIGTTYGPGMREALFTYIALDSVLNEKKMEIHGDGLQTRQLIHVDDLTAGICEATHHFYDGEFSNEMFNLCGIEKISAMDTVQTAERIVGKKAIYKHTEDRNGQIRDERISIQRAKDLLSWEPKITFAAGMQKTYEEDSRFK